MRTVQSLRDELANFPADALCYAYEGEITGVVVVEPGAVRRQLGYVCCGTAGDGEEEPETNFEVKPPAPTESR